MNLEGDPTVRQSGITCCHLQVGVTHSTSLFRASYSRRCLRNGVPLIVCRHCRTSANVRRNLSVTVVDTRTLVPCPTYNVTPNSTTLAVTASLIMLYHYGASP